MKLLRSTTAFCRQLKTFCSSLPLDIRIQTNDCLVMRPRSASRWGGGAIQLPLLQLQSNSRQEERMKLGLWLRFVHYVVFMLWYWWLGDSKDIGTAEPTVCLLCQVVLFQNRWMRRTREGTCWPRWRNDCYMAVVLLVHLNSFTVQWYFF